MSKSIASVPVRRGNRRDRTIQRHEHDMYRMPRKPSEPSVCPDCGAFFERGRWKWGRAPKKATNLRCPACSRIRYRAPKGLITLRGAFLRERQAEIMNLVSNEESRARVGHPLARVMDIEERPDEIVISTTDNHLARRIGEALHDAYSGALEVQYPRGREFVRVVWER